MEVSLGVGGIFSTVGGGGGGVVLNGIFQKASFFTDLFPNTLCRKHIKVVVRIERS